MAQNPPSKTAREAEGLTQGEAISVAVAVGWMVAVGIYFWTLPSAPENVSSLDGARLILLFLAVFMPVALIWVAGVAARGQRRLREDIARLEATQEALRREQMVHATHLRATAATVPPPAAAPAPPPPPVPVAAEEAKPVSRFTSRREVSRLIVPRAAPQPTLDQPGLALNPAIEDANPPLERPDLIKALNFPDDEHDTDGFAALRRALRDRNARQLVQASQDVLTLLSQDGIYMDDLRPKAIPPDLWRRFAKGDRGADLDQLGAIKHADAQRAIAGRMREDTIFRDAVHHFLRRFDQMLISFAAHATDTDLLALADTRTARAFMVLGRATGAFE